MSVPKKPKRRSIASYRAASRKAWRTRKKMEQVRHFAITVEGDWQTPDRIIAWRTIDRIPKVEWE